MPGHGGSAFAQVAVFAWKPDHLRLLHRVQFYIRSIFLYLDRTYVIQTAGVSSLWDLGLQLWRDNVIAESEVEKKLIVGLLSLVERERDGEMVERDLIKNLIRMLASIGVYAERFERSFVMATGKYYSQEVRSSADRWVLPLSFSWSYTRALGSRRVC